MHGMSATLLGMFGIGTKSPFIALFGGASNVHCAFKRLGCMYVILALDFFCCWVTC
jgi:hypothetical protein